MVTRYGLPIHRYARIHNCQVGNDRTKECKRTRQEGERGKGRRGRDGSTRW